MKNTLQFLLFTFLFFLNTTLSAQKVGLGNTTPFSTLHITSNDDNGLLIENQNTLNAGVQSGIYFGNNVINNPGGYRFTGAMKTIGTNTNEARIGLFTNASSSPGSLVERFSISDIGNIGIGDIDPAYKLDVAGSIHTTGSAYVDGNLGLGTTSPAYKLQVNNGSIALHNTTDLKTWYFSYNSGSNYLYLSEGGSTRLVVENGGNVGIGTSNPATKLDVAGNINSTGNLDIDGNLTVNAGKGVVRSYNGTQFKYYTREAAFGAVLNGFQLSAEGSFGFASAGFTSAPAVTVGNIVSTGGTVGELYRVQLIVYDCTTTSCKCRLLNTSPNPVNYDVTYNIICIGQ